jgi:hypothetical protein
MLLTWENAEQPSFTAWRTIKHGFRLYRIPAESHLALGVSWYLCARPLSECWVSAFAQSGHLDRQISLATTVC